METESDLKQNGGAPAVKTVESTAAAQPAAGILGNVKISGTVRCSNYPYNALPNVPVDANGIYCVSTNSTGYYEIWAPTGTYDLTADPSDHGTRTYYDVLVGSSGKMQNFNCSHLPGATL